MPMLSDSFSRGRLKLCLMSVSLCLAACSPIARTSLAMQCLTVSVSMKLIQPNVETVNVSFSKTVYVD